MLIEYDDLTDEAQDIDDYWYLYILLGYTTFMWV